MSEEFPQIVLSQMAGEAIVFFFFFLTKDYTARSITPGDGKPGVDAFQASCPQPYSQPHPLGTPTQILCIVIKIELQE